MDSFRNNTATLESTRHRRREGLNDVHADNEERIPLEQRALSGRRERASPRRRARAATAYLVIGTLYLLMTVFVHHRLNSYPHPKNGDNSFPYEFRESNARSHLEIIANFGPRVSGSDAHLKAENYILATVQQISSKKLHHNEIEVDLQTTSGGFNLDFTAIGLGEFTSVYQDLRNVVVKLSPKGGANYSVLINCHYDSVIDSPGAGDDAASCAVMLEILRALSQSNVVLKHNIIFLFNSAEENILQTSHGFITQHRWAPSIKAFVNLDSAGAGGWEIVFQTGPEHPWLIKAYIESAPYPYASVVGQEIFQTGLIPSDTDFRIFRDYGNIPGLDIAHIKNGYVYHTKNDQPQFIPAGCMQRGGENVLATLIHLATSSKLVNPGEDKHGSMVFFDYLGFFMVAYPQRMASILNWTTFIYVYVAFLKRLLRERAAGSGNIIKPMLSVMLAVLATWIITLLTPIAMALFLSAFGRSLSYFTHNLNIIWLFILPSITGALAFHLLLKNTVFKNVDPTSIVVMLQESNLMLWSVVLLLMAKYNLMSSFLPLMCILWPAFCYTLLEICGFKPTGLFFNFLASFVPSLYLIYMSYTLLMFLIPIMGRSGMESSPDLLIATVSGIPVMVCLPYQIGFVYTHNRVGRVITTTVAVILLGLTAVIFTPAGFPYSYYSHDASPQRAMLVHFDRRFHAKSGAVVTKDAYIWYKPLDYHGGKLLEMHAPDVLAKARKATCDGVYCGRPYLYPLLHLVDAVKTFDFPASHINLTRVGVELINRTYISDSEVRLNFVMSGPSHVTIFISEFPLARVKQWSFGHNFPVEIFTVPSIHFPTFFIYYAHAGPPNLTWEFHMDIEVERHKSINSSLIKMGFAGHYLHGPHQYTPDLLALEQEFPPWILPVRWSATYDEYVF